MICRTLGILGKHRFHLNTLLIERAYIERQVPVLRFLMEFAMGESGYVIRFRSIRLTRSDVIMKESFQTATVLNRIGYIKTLRINYN